MFNSESAFDAQLPGLVVKNIVPLPKNEIRLEISNDSDIKLIKSCEQYKNYILLLVPTQDGGYNPYGVVARIVLNMSVPNGGRYIKPHSYSKVLDHSGNILLKCDTIYRICIGNNTFKTFTYNCISLF